MSANITLFFDTKIPAGLLFTLAWWKLNTSSFSLASAVLGTEGTETLCFKPD